MKIQKIIVLIALIGSVSSAQDKTLKVYIEDVSFLAGSWEGHLEYLDYQDDETKVKLPLRMTATMKTSEEDYQQYIHIKSSYKEPNGTEVKDESEIKILNDGEAVSFEGKWKLIERKINKEEQSYKLVLTGKGEDNHITSDFRKTITRNKDHLTVTKEVQHEDTEKWFVRNEYSLKVSK